MVIVNDKLLLILFVAALALIVLGLFDFWLISIIFMLLLIISLMLKMSADEKIEKIEKNRSRLVTLVTDRLDGISGGIDNVRNDFNKSVFALENRVSEVKHSYETEMEENYRELAKKIFDVENKLNVVKKTLGAAYGSIDERLQRLEKKPEEEI